MFRADIVSPHPRVRTNSAKVARIRLSRGLLQMPRMTPASKFKANRVSKLEEDNRAFTAHVIYQQIFDKKLSSENERY